MRPLLRMVVPRIGLCQFVRSTISDQCPLERRGRALSDQVLTTAAEQPRRALFVVLGRHGTNRIVRGSSLAFQCFEVINDLVHLLRFELELWHRGVDRLIDTLPGAPHEASSLAVGMERR